MVFLAYGILVVAVIFLSIKISFYVDQLDKKTNLSSAFIGGVMLAAVTSLPEVFTSLSSVLFLSKPEMVIGNILGSNLFNICILALVFLLNFKELSQFNIAKSHNTNIMTFLLIYALLVIDIFINLDVSVGPLSAISIVIILFYVFAVCKMSQDDNTSKNSDLCDLTIRQITIRFVFLSMLLIVTSVAITYVSDYLGLRLGFSSTISGALLLGVATSLPEVVTCFALCRLKNFNAMISNIVGSNLFNFVILTLADLFYLGNSIYVFTPHSNIIIGLSILNSLCVMSCITHFTIKSDAAYKFRYIYKSICLIPIISYIAFIAFSM